ncbi:MAG: glycosyltransferase [Lachnospiraceae bacterium]|jgi:glycosyltransferase involved in cell wall biosynthesis|nr:glycosyltransferase [Lachnospiraceae bacterium]
MTELGLVSVIVAVYNIKEYLPRCVESIMAQTCHDLEIILVDDGSSDGSEVLCDEYAGKDERIKVIHKLNGGLSDARNAGLAVATGRYIGYVDGDDYIEPEMYMAMREAVRGSQAQVAVCGFRQLGTDSVPVSGIFTGQVIGLSGVEAMEIYICGHKQYRIYPSVWSKLFDRATVADLLFEVGVSSEDIMYTTEALSRSKRVVYVDRPYYNYIVDRQGSIMNKKVGERRFSFELPIWRKQTDYLLNLGMDELAKKSRYYFYRRMLFYYIEFRRSGEKGYARRLARMVKSERSTIKATYRHNWVTSGDRVRMNTLLFSPGLYYRIVVMYDKFLIPLRNKRTD